MEKFFLYSSEKLSLKRIIDIKMLSWRNSAVSKVLLSMKVLLTAGTFISLCMLFEEFHVRFFKWEHLEYIPQSK